MRVAVRVLLGVAAWPLLVAVFAALHVPIGSGIVRAYAVLTLVGSLAVYLHRRSSPERSHQDDPIWPMLAVLIATLALRCWQVRDVVWPLWGDAVNHTAAVALFLEQHGLPNDWGRYIPTSTTFSYHFGFHAWAAALSWTTDVPAWWAVFWTERFLSTLAPLGVYLLAATFYRDRRVALGAAVIVGLLTKMPQYYVNFSRDTQLLGQTLLPLVAYLLAGTLRSEGRVAAGVLAALSFTAMVFAHYLVYELALGLVLAVWILRAGRQHRLSAFVRLGVITAAGAALAAPWIWQVLQTQQAVWRSAYVTYSADFGRLFFEAPPILEYETLPLLAAGLIGVAVGIRHHTRSTLSLLIWLACMLVCANGYRTPIRALHQVNYIAVYMALYLITGPLVGVVATHVSDLLKAGTRIPRWSTAAAGIALGVVIGFAAYGNIISDTYVLVEAEDVRAFDWIAHNTDEDAGFLINAFSATGEDGLVVGSDAGWWLTIVTGREVSVPVINYQTELVSAEYVERMQTLAAYDTATLVTDRGAADLCAFGITHVFTGAVGGPLDDAALLLSPHYHLLYEDGAAMVLAIDCPSSAPIRVSAGPVLAEVMGTHRVCMSAAAVRMPRGDRRATEPVESMTMSGGSVDMSVVICAYTDERWDDLVAAVGSVERQTVPPRQVILVVDHNPSLYTRCRQAFPTMTIVENAEQRGISGARNSGVAQARSPVVAFLDDDAEAAPDWLERLAEGYCDPNVMGVGGSIAPQWHTRAPEWFPTEFYWTLGCSHSAMPGTASPTRNMIGANMSVRREVLEALGGFRHCFGRVGTRYSADETDLCIRGLQRWPHRVWLYQPSAQVTHKQPAGRTTRRFFVTRCYDEGVSKARLSKAVGTADGLANEYWYTFHVLPRAFLQALGDGVFRGQLYGISRAIAIAVGFTATGVGYVLSTVRERFLGRGGTDIPSAPTDKCVAPDRTPGRCET